MPNCADGALIKKVRRGESVRRNFWKGGWAILGATAISTVGMTQAHAQSDFWSPRIVAAPYEMNGFLNKEVTTVADVMAGKDPSQSWRQKVVEGQNLRAYYVGLKVGDQTRKVLSTDHRIGFIVWEGSIEVTVQGQPTLMAKKGTMIQVPARLEYQLKNVGTTPSLHFEVFPKEMEDFPTLIYPETAATLPAPAPGQQWTLSEIGAPDTFTRLPAQNANFNFFRHYLDSPSSGEFVRDDRFFMNAIRENGNVNAPTNPDIGHFHVYGEEFWFVIEGRVGFLKEGSPYSFAEAGSIIYNPPMRWHRMGTHPGSGAGTRIAINGYRFGDHHLPRPTNTSSDNQFAFSIVNTPPTTTPTLSPAPVNGWYRNPTVTLTAYPHAQSPEDGMDYSEYRLDAAPEPTRYAGPFQITGDGVHILDYGSVDKAGNVEATKSVVVMVDTTPPSGSLTLSASTLWPPNHKLVAITPTLSYADNLSAVRVSGPGVTSNEPQSGCDADDVGSDWEVSGAGLKLRAERCESGGGRVYTVTYTLTDEAGNSSQVSATVSVPHNR
jgi:quercetin dioxygenase-like cupin family protein